MSNNITVTGVVGKEPVIREMGQTGGKVMEFTIADKVWRAGKDHTNWRKVEVIIGKRDPGNYPFSNIRVGSAVVIKGEEVDAEWTDREGNKRTQSVLQNAEIMSATLKPGAEPQRNTAPPASRNQRPANNAPAGDGFIDDSIPF